MADRIEVTLGIKVNGQPVLGGPIVRVVTVEESRLMTFAKNGGDSLPPTDQIPIAKLGSAAYAFLRTSKAMSVQIPFDDGIVPLDADGFILIFGAQSMTPAIAVANTGTPESEVTVAIGGTGVI